LKNDFSRLRFLKGIELEVKFAEKRTLLKGKPLNTVDPDRVMRAVLALKRHLYDRPFDPQGFIDGLFAVYQKLNHAPESGIGAFVPAQTIYV
jgi:hypothetical protein